MNKHGIFNQAALITHYQAWVQCVHDTNYPGDKLLIKFFVALSNIC